ncbi:MAG TPA: type II toxin-antitoxin system HicB family antitoxin [Desulfuromonadales bacterium]|nr:type II toxin-antitoxin system HicB family antitoxin [Desulfuromonadales bacterium]
MKYDQRKYTYRIEWSDEDQVHIARCLEFPSLATHGKTPEKALKEIEFVVAESIRWIEEEGGVVPEPLGTRHYKGNITLRVPPDVHRNLAMLSAEQGVSINQLVLSRL